MGARYYLALALACVLSAGVFSMAVASWWGMRGNHLHGLGNWVVGKDTGKFVFYTYAFMFDPLAKGRIDLASHMGFQEIRYRQSEDRSSRLDALSVDCAISKECYLWVTLHASPRRVTGCGYPTMRSIEVDFMHTMVAIALFRTSLL